ncbi:unnamed protein product, partial [Ectocarpus fasciculatus]
CPRGNFWERAGYTKDFVAQVMLYTTSPRRLYCTPRTTSPLSLSMALAHRRASRASAPGRRGRGAGFPTADTAPPTPGHIPREFLVLHAAGHD